MPKKGNGCQTTALGEKNGRAGESTAMSRLSGEVFAGNKKKPRRALAETAQDPRAPISIISFEIRLLLFVLFILLFIHLISLFYFEGNAGIKFIYRLRFFLQHVHEG